VAFNGTLVLLRIQSEHLVLQTEPHANLLSAVKTWQFDVGINLIGIT